MIQNNYKDHIISFLKGLLAAVITSAGLAFIQYLGAHVPELIQFMTVTATSTAAVVKAQQ